MVKVDINGAAHEITATVDAPLVDILRDELHLTGTKLVCGSGVCGACTVLLDGQPVVSCLLPTPAVDGRQVTTVEGVAAAGHPVTRAFAAHNALQCGFCTPGFVVEAAAFHDRWRAEHGETPPDDATIAAELSGHLCRCGAYPEIYAATRAACEGAFDAPGEPVGPRREAAAKVSGRAQYTVDIGYEGQLEGRILRSPHPHARVASLDLAPAIAIAGARAAVSLVPEDGFVRYLGQEVAAVAADDRETAERALAAVIVEYEPLPAVVDLDAAMEPDAPQVYAGGNRQPPSAAEGPQFPARWHGNVRGPAESFSVGKRAVLSRLTQAREREDPLLFEGVFQTEAQPHTAFEPHAATARFDGVALDVHVSTQSVAHLAEQIADRFGLAADQVRVFAEHVGGGFGSKLALTPETVAAIMLARASQAPVRVALDRLEELSSTGYRPPARIELALLAGADANLRAVRMVTYANAGIAVGNLTAGLARLIYPTDAKELVDYDVVTNLAPGSPFRGPGGPQMCFALEQAIDEVARRLGWDPIALRNRWDPDPLRRHLYHWAAGLSAWQDRAALPRGGRFRRGVGVAAGNWFYFWEPGCAVELAVDHGHLVASTSVQDIGTGSRSVLANAVAGAFGLDPAEVEVRLGDSSLPRGPMSGGSRTTATIVPAALDAATRLQLQLAPLAGADGWRAAFSRPEAQGRSVTSRRPPDDRRAARQASPPMGGAGAAGASFTWQMRLLGNLNVGRGSTSAVHVAEVEVDTRLGHTRVLRMHAGIAAGRLAAPELAAAQVHGGVIQGLGYALYEQRDVDPHTGLVLSANLEDYRIPGIADTPEIALHFESEGFDHVPGKGVGLGEVCTLPAAAAVANAVHDATGARAYHLPIRPDRLLGLLGGVS